MESSTFFYGSSHPFSNWHKSIFYDSNGLQFNTSEQYMMYQKAILFNDQETAKKVLKCKNPREQKKLGRSVQGFEETLWEQNKFEIVCQGCKLKFQQNPEMLEVLIASAGTEIVEASPVDTIWGVGLDENDPLIHDKSNWRGSNLLGEVLMRVREELIHEPNP